MAYNKSFSSIIIMYYIRFYEGSKVLYTCFLTIKKTKMRKAPEHFFIILTHYGNAKIITD
jgi:hypothetical protein